MDYRTEDFVLRQYEGVSVLRFTGQSLTGMAELERITKEVEGLIDRGLRKLVLDFKRVQYISSAALGMLIAAQKKMATAGGSLVLSHPEPIQELLKISHTERLFRLAPDPKAAVEMLK